MNDDPHAKHAAMLQQRLQKNRRRLVAWAAREGYACFRLYDKDIPEIPVTVDVYGDDIVVNVFEPRHGGGRVFDSWANAMGAAALIALGKAPAQLHLKKRSVHAFGAGAQSADVAKKAAPLLVTEGPARLWVRLDDHLDTGLFLDHRPLRARVREQAHGKHVLNLFAYTGAFSVHAGLGGAARTVTVDLSPRYCAWAEENLQANGLSSRDHAVVVGDAFRFLRETRARFDLIVLDPPTVSKSHRAEGALDIARDHPLLINGALALLAPGGTLYFSCNLQKFVLAREALHVDNVAVADITSTTVPPDFKQAPPPHHAFRFVRAPRA